MKISRMSMKEKVNQQHVIKERRNMYISQSMIIVVRTWVALPLAKKIVLVLSVKHGRVRKVQVTVCFVKCNYISKKNAVKVSEANYTPEQLRIYRKCDGVLPHMSLGSRNVSY